MTTYTIIITIVAVAGLSVGSFFVGYHYGKKKANVMIHAVLEALTKAMFGDEKKEPAIKKKK